MSTLFGYLAKDGAVSDDWFEQQVAYADRTDGDIDTLANRIAHIRTWTFAANRPNWLRDPFHWQERTRAIEDRLSDALHERLTRRFVDRRTSVLMRRLKENAMLEAEITPTGDVLVEGQHVGSLDGFRFAPDPKADGPEAKALRAAAQKALAGEIAERAERVATASNSDLILASDGTLRWQGAAIARIAEGDDALKPRLILLADEALASVSRDRVQARVELWLANHAETLLKPLFDLRAAETLAPVARGIAFRLVENLGVTDRSEIAEEVRALDQDARAGMRSLGVRFGAHNIYVPLLLKPAPSGLLAILWALKNGGLDRPGLGELTLLAASGRTSVPVNTEFPRALYRTVGYQIVGQRAVRVDILERLADLIRPLIAWRRLPDGPEPPDGAVEGNGFTVTVAMTSLLGCSGDDFAAVLRGLGYRSERRPVPPKEAPAPDAPPVAAGQRAETIDQPATAEAAAEESVATAEQLASVPIASNDNVAPDEQGSVPAAATATVDAESTQPVEPDAAPADAAPAPPAEPAFIEIWRPGRFERRGPPREAKRTPPQRPKPEAERPHEGGEAAPPKPDTRRPKHSRPPGRKDDRRNAAPPSSPPPPRPERREKPLDPDSPFAALAALKAQLEAKERNG